MAGKLTNRAEVIAFVGAYVAGDRIIALISANLLPWLIENGHEDKITLAGWAISLAVMVVVLPAFLVLRRWLAGGCAITGRSTREARPLNCQMPGRTGQSAGVNAA